MCQDPPASQDRPAASRRRRRLRLRLTVDGQRSLPGAFLHEGDTLVDSIRRSLRDKAGISDVEPSQLHVFDALHHDERGRVPTVAHQPKRRLDQLRTYAELVQIDQARNLRYNQDEIIQRAVMELRRTTVGCLTQAGCFSIRPLARTATAPRSRCWRRDEAPHVQTPHAAPARRHRNACKRHRR